MDNHQQDMAAIAYIQKLAAEEHKLFESKTRTDAESKRLRHIQVQLDQCWDLLRQRRAAKETGHNPKDAQLRPPIVVENYKG